jgi:4-hydroxy-tetrahydrodipicolinate reductase
MRNIKLIVSGVGGVGSNVIHLLSKKKGIDIIGVIDIDEDKIGKDAGIVAGIKPINVFITNDTSSLYEKGADVVICTSAPTSPEETFREMRHALESRINVIVANMGTCNLWNTNPKLAVEIDAISKKYGVSYFGIGATQLQERFILLNTEGCSKVDKITFTHFADLHSFRPESFRKEWGVTLTENEFYEGLKNGSIQKHDYFAEGISYIAERFGWKIDKVITKHEPMVDANKIVYGTHYTFVGYIESVAKIETNWVFLLDEERRYFDHIVVEGTPYIDSMNRFSPDRGMVSTFASLVNAVPYALKCEPGYINTLDLPLCTIVCDDI